MKLIRVAMFAPHPNLGDTANRNIIRSEVEGGVYLRDLPAGSLLEIETKNRAYRLMIRSEGQTWISGHPSLCPEPVPVHVHGSNWGGSMIKLDYVGRGMHLEFRHLPLDSVVVTSRIVDVRLL